jgi:signal transduction histidine kinase
VEEVLADLRRRSQDEKKPMQFECEIPTDLPEVLGDSSRVRQVLANLVTNSFNYTPADGCVQVKLQRENGHVQVSVQDNGIGIALKDQERIFERFYRGEDTLVLATAGTGLGLAIAKILIEMHHGKIWFTSSGVRGEGATFSFTLPVIHTEE